jgi:hypothetical protein
MLLRVALAAGSLLLVPSAQALTITYDLGGRIDRYEARWRAMAARGTPSRTVRDGDPACAPWRMWKQVVLRRGELRAGLAAQAEQVGDIGFSHRLSAQGRGMRKSRGPRTF